MKSILLTFSAALMLGGVSTSAFAQAGHEGHNHSAPTAGNYVMAPLPDMDHVFTESPDDHVMGANTAPVTVIMYASVMCPHCAQWFTSEWSVFKESYIDTGAVRFVFREFPTAPANHARTGFVIANCAPEEVYFDHMVYQMQAQDFIFSAIRAGQARPMYQSLAYQAGMTTPEAMRACFSTSEPYERIERSQLRAQIAGIQSVPGFIVDGAVFKGNPTAAGLATEIDARLSTGVSEMPPQMSENMSSSSEVTPTAPVVPDLPEAE